MDKTRNNKLASQLRQTITRFCKKIEKNISIMEVCGTHTVALFRSGIREMLPSNMRIISGPGCPVCVTDQADVDRAIGLCQLENTIVTTFGDMMQVPGTEVSLEQMKAQGRDVRVVYSALDALEIAKTNNENVIHIAVGFETTAPTIAAVLKRAKQEKVNNFYVLSANKIVPPALECLVACAKSRINAFILPGHVSAIIGAKPYQFLADKYNKPCVIAGFEPVDILQAIAMLCKQIVEQKSRIEIQYTRCVQREGNILAQKILREVFEVRDAQWRGLGVMKKSGFFLNKNYAGFEARENFKVKIPKPKKTPCRCGDVLQGVILPPECKLFQNKCTPENPIGPCMVSTEGTCAAYYRYARVS
ncbi:MAG: hydrogenase formation protein HypD [Candidatus Omnitrophota bacterium]